MNNIEHYQDKANRDARAEHLKACGYPFKKRSSRGSVLSPSAVEDFTGTSYPNGSARFFTVLYTLEY